MLMAVPCVVELQGAEKSVTVHCPFGETLRAEFVGLPMELVQRLYVASLGRLAVVVGSTITAPVSLTYLDLAEVKRAEVASL